MYSEILHRCRTYDELNTLASELDAIEESEFLIEENLNHVLSTSVRSWVAQEIVAESKEIGIKEYLKGLRKAILEKTPIQLDLGFEPTGDTINKIYDWIVAKVGNNVVLQITYDPSVVAGARLSYKGNYGDYSVGTKMKNDEK